MRTFIRYLTLFLTGAMLAGTLTLVAMTPARADYITCNPWWTSADRHSKGAHCDDGPERQYRVKVEFCGASGCFYAYGAWKNWGAPGRSTATSSTAYAGVHSGIFQTRP